MEGGKASCANWWPCTGESGFWSAGEGLELIGGGEVGGVVSRGQTSCVCV